MLQAVNVDNQAHRFAQLVNTETDSLIANERVQDCLEKAKEARKKIVRYVQVGRDAMCPLAGRLKI